MTRGFADTGIPTCLPPICPPRLSAKGVRDSWPWWRLRCTAGLRLSCRSPGHPRPLDAFSRSGTQRDQGRRSQRGPPTGSKRAPACHTTPPRERLSIPRRGCGHGQRVEIGRHDHLGGPAGSRRRRAAGAHAARLLPATADTPATDPLAVLSDRERDVVTLLLEGLSYAQIARELYVTRSTVAFHLSNAYAKTGTASRHELVQLVQLVRAA